MEIKRILWPTDLSDNSEAARPFVESLGEKYQTEVHVLYVMEDLGRHAPWYGEFDPKRIKEIHEWERTKAEERLEEICRKHLKGCPAFFKEIALGDPAEEILGRIKQKDIDMVVMATRGRKGRFSFGSVTDKVVKGSPVPVVTIPVRD